ncbi:hypothetical protein BS78_03G267600 [Paspalum vaginatum]|nr:hypothetical protein BS78_03G267600 [Paspalum vaginatum]
MKQTVVLYPGAGAGHIIPMGELAKAFLNRGYDVTMVIVPPPFKSAALGASHVERLAAANPSMSIHVLPPIPAPDFAGSAKHPFLLVLQLMRQYNERLENFLRSIPRQRLHSLVIDMFCVDAIDVAGKLGGVPVYTFVPSGASALAVLTQLPTLMAGRQTGLKELGDTRLEFLGVPPMPASHLVAELLEHPEEELCKTMLSIFERGMDSMGVLVNTFESLERRAVQALRDPLCVPGKALPPIYCVGPLVGGGGARNGGNTERQECLAWLDAQPERSVVLLCFGSMGAFSAEQTREIAVGLEKSGHRFLWVVRMTAANVDDPKRLMPRQSEPDIDALLPEGFLERTKDRGLVVKSWAPQVDVLNHPATGAFVTHCGWNSTMEGVTAGVPMLCWPLYAEQKMNKVFMTEDMGVGMEMQGYETGFVKAEEMEKKVRLLMESDVGRDLRTRAAARKKEAEAALKDGGSSQAAFVQFLSDVENR